MYVNGTSFVLPLVLSSKHKIAACMGLSKIIIYSELLLPALPTSPSFSSFSPARLQLSLTSLVPFCGC